ncbi:phenylalanine--tRNA ligase subunit beta [Desulfurobacterium atlanticum]|uniref:Phenylalanine--tRNA ligase beta subunit n=1 Tax=Desulfurobacterium atlanticum TaxID=240169 RepID=A0A238Y5P6_9BACT|nr:phenylalanine--tRNA ligase subunit beta [Desulfurobacterium atlanticum]SNR66111.1 phenylalanyl-tRNA synthetase beta subunit [Desulfurobacterium atlanticum]
MRITYNWLKEFINIEDYSAEEIADILTDIGIEVDSVYYAGKDIEKVVIGKILTIEKHPNADKLKICQVDIGDTVLQIVTGADNIFEGAVVPVALHGSKLPIGIRIKKSKLRGVESNGMLCSEEELGLTTHSDGIMILPEDANLELGADAVKALGLDDWIIEYEITTNRPDALSILGIARELKAVLGREIVLPEISYTTIEKKASEELELVVEDEKGCPRYDGFVAKDVKVKHSPLFMQIRLYLVGLRPINNVVDITNYVLYEIGQPLHAFDESKIKDKTIVVRKAKDGEKIVTLDGVERTLTSSDLVIADTEKPLALAGIMGGEDSGVTYNTTDVVLESAHFDPFTIRKTAKRLGLSTDASYRFERGADIEATIFAAERALHLLQKYADANILSGKVEFYPKPYTPKVIVFNPDKVKKLIGVDIPPRKSFEILASLGFPVKKEQDYIVVKVPSWRKYDISREVDIIEEIVRIYGMKNVKSTYPLMHSDVERPRDFFNIVEIKEFLAAKGLTEVINYSFISKKLYETFGLDFDSLVKISNPLSEEWVGMRDVLFPSLINNCVQNIKRNEKDIAIFETAVTFEDTGKDLPEERLHLSILLSGKVSEGMFRERKVDFYDLKGFVEELVDFLNLTPEFEREEDKSFLHPGQAAKLIIDGKYAGFLGRLHPDIDEKFEIKQPVYIAEIDLELLLELAKGKVAKFKKLPKFPPVTRDIAVLVDKDVFAKDVEKIIVKSAGKLLEKIKLFDIYEGENIPEGKKSLAFSLTFRSSEKTLSDEEVSRIIEKVVKNLEKENIHLRA